MVHEWDALEQWFEEQSQFIQLDTVLRKCQDINPSLHREYVLLIRMMFQNKYSHAHAFVVGTGGLIMERWIRQFGSRQTRRDFNKLRRGNISQPMMRDTITTRINVKNRVGFYVFVLQSLNHRGNSVKSQLFYLSMLWRHKGMSESGSQILAKLSLSVSPSYYLSQMKFETQVETNKFR